VKYFLSVVCVLHVINGIDMEGNLLIRVKLLKFCMFVLVCDLNQQEWEIHSSDSADYKEGCFLGC
jgi:hypothetical protein